MNKSDHSDSTLRKTENKTAKLGNSKPETSYAKAVSIYGGLKGTSSSMTENNSPSKTNTQQSSAIKKAPAISKPAIGQTTMTIKKQQTVSNRNQKSVPPDQVKIKKVLIRKELLLQLPQELVLEILDYYVGSGFKACLPENQDLNNIDGCNLVFNESLFFRQYFGKFTNRGEPSPKLIFKRAAVPLDDKRSPMEFHRLLSLATRNGIAIDDYFRNLCCLSISNRSKRNIDLGEIEVRMLNYITSVFGKDKEICEKITSLNLTHMETFESFVDFAANNFPNIESVKLGFTNRSTKGFVFYKSFDMSRVIESLCKLCNLKEFSFIGSNFYCDGFDDLSKATPLVEKIFISSEVSLIKCGKSIGNWKNLKEIHLQMFTQSYSRRPANPHEQTEFITALKDLNIERMVLINEELAKTSVHYFPSSITCLDLQQTTLNAELMQAIGNLTSLKMLGLDCCSGFERDDFRHLKGLTNLEEISVTQSSNCGDIGAKHIAEIHSLKRVYLMNLSQDQIHDEGGLALAKLEKLELIDLQYCDITEQTIIFLAKNCINLKKIFVSGCNKINKTKLPPNTKKLLKESIFYRTLISFISEE